MASSQKAKCVMTAASQFKHINGRDGKVESICMNCLLAVGICSSDEELLAKESMHVCDTKASKIGPRKSQRPDRPKSLLAWVWNGLAAVLPLRRQGRYSWPETSDE